MMNRFCTIPRTIYVATFLLWLAASVGCGGNAAGLRQIKGKLLLDGEPVENAIVTFLPSGGGQSASGVTRRDGTFALSTYTPNDGVKPGEYRVSIMPKDPPAMPGGDYDPSMTGRPKRESGPSKAVPDRYASPESSELTATVPEKGPADILLELSRS
jgi:hypothetical protein